MPDIFRVNVNEQGQVKVPQGGGMLRIIDDNTIPLNAPCPPGVGLGGFCWNSYGICDIHPEFIGELYDGLECYVPVYTYTCQQDDPDGPDGPLPANNICSYELDQIGAPAVQFYAVCGRWHSETGTCGPPAIA